MSARQRRPITRNREMQACTECRRRKLKCDRGTPCSSCVKRKDEAGCVYQRYARGLGNERERRIEAETRLEHLEQLVQQLAQPGPSKTEPIVTGTSMQASSNSDGSGSSNGISTGVLNHGGDYSGSTHWSAMLEDIEELRYAMSSNNDLIDDDLNSSSAAVDVLFGSGPAASYEQVLSQFLPSKQEIDRLTAAYFRSKAIAAPFVHSSQFRRQYQLFWQDPGKAPPLWTSLLFTICHIASTVLMPPNGSVVGDSRYSLAAAHCLAIGAYFQGRRFSVEALLLFCQSRIFTNLDIPEGVGTILSIVLHLATKLGYHRDPENFAMSAFEKEMRRRTWSLCLQLDLLTAFQFGRPSTVQYPTWDTKPPANLFDYDFDENTEVLPPSRPDTEITDIMFYITKHRLVIPFEKVLRHSLATSEDGATNVDELDSEICRTYASLPEVLLPRPMAESFVDSPWLTVTRLCVAFMYHKSRCVLHRKYVTMGRAVSIRTCYESASALVRAFLDAYQEFQTGGQMESERWFLSSITWHDYLIGVTSLCLVVCTLSQNSFGVDIDGQETLELLRKSHGTCLEQSKKDAAETRRAARALAATIALFEGQIDQVQSEQASQYISYGMVPPQTAFQNMPQNMAPQPVFQADSELVGGNGWGWEEDFAEQVGDPSWAYLEHFLNIPNDDLMADLQKAV